MPNDGIVVRGHCVDILTVRDHEDQTVKQPEHTKKLPQGKQEIEHGGP
ncbi:MAG: hypothetical protein ACXWCY_29495 [Burkholderiales bacterium]